MPPSFVNPLPRNDFPYPIAYPISHDGIIETRLTNVTTNQTFDLTSAFDEYLKRSTTKGREAIHKFFRGFVSSALHNFQQNVILAFVFGGDDDDGPTFDAKISSQFQRIEKDLIDRIRRAIEQQTGRPVSRHFIENFLEDSGVHRLLKSVNLESLLATCLDIGEFVKLQSNFATIRDTEALEAIKGIDLRLAKYEVRRRGLAIRDSGQLISSLRKEIRARIQTVGTPGDVDGRESRASGLSGSDTIHGDSKERIGKHKSKHKKLNSVRIWKHITISRDETSASDFLNQRILILFFKRHFQIDEDADLENRNLRFIEGSKFTQKEQPLLPFDTYSRPEIAAEQGWFRQTPHKKASFQHSSKRSPEISQIDAMESGTLESPTIGTKGTSNGPAADCPENLQHRQLVHRATSLNPENQSLENSQVTSGSWKIIHMIPQPLGQPPQAYLDKPVWAPGFGRDNFRLKAFLPVSNVQDYVQQTGLDFTISRFYSETPLMPELRRALAKQEPPPDPIHYYEQIHLHSRQMVEALQEFLTSHSEFLKKSPNFNVRAPISAPYIFWYTCRSTAALQQLSHPHQYLMRTLTSWIDTNYDKKYDEAKAHLENGVVTLGTMPFLLCPGDVLVWKEKGKTKAAVTSSEVSQKSSPILYWDSSQILELGSSKMDGPKGEFSTTWGVDVWSYRFNGAFLRDKRPREIKFKASSLDQEVHISKLGVYPLRFADEKTKLQLETRGKTFWTCRYRNLVSHTGEESLFTVSGPNFMECTLS